ncbi:hypothetical protein SAMN04487943_11454 [Gracilibacillus orientalis]|uniref:DUF4177 domain-containing protein n=1 Tax=Gracilibacillus orientalis TaxID=334253 RepID=A0A1I4Q442_9BACI|nr:hypothetical protein [Gracilibacillus orientalis]SFM34626.1 hypothetical protein SAMN04487943_11454 [Gracilibacillus orientalis]
MKQFEYKVEDMQIRLTVNNDFNTIITDKLNSIGRDGWELAGVNGTLCFFKREIIFD